GEEMTLIVNRLPMHDEAGKLIGFLSQSLFGAPEELQRLSEKIAQLGRKVHFYRRRFQSALSAVHSVDNILGQSVGILRAKEHLTRYAATDFPVLILGATGTGKELFASALHNASRRCEGPYVSINCAAIPQELFESEFFGYAAGAFTGARKEGRVGHIELADNGTLFLDEIGDMPMQAQVKLLRVLEDKIVFRIGSQRPNKVDFRIVAATNQDPKMLIRTGKFREDLYYRLSTMVLTIQPLCERKEDIPLLVSHVLEQIERSQVHFSDEAMDALVRYSWPGNIRELRNVVMRVASLCSSDTVQLGDLPQDILTDRGSRGNAADRPALASILEGSEQSLILDALRSENWNMVRAAKALGIGRATLYEKTKKYHIHRE
ncbi:MAG: sigma 54-interacting transcriptional regulator, partial [Humidesulfovibrio sp.]|nr:sigma 54-interacting transcriptional regulator [Humidesulfovibrio sp.]